MPKRSKANNGMEAAEPKRRSERLQTKPQTPLSESKPKKAPAKPKKVKEAEKGGCEEKAETGCGGVPAENGEANSGKEAPEVGEDEQEMKRIAE